MKDINKLVLEGSKPLAFKSRLIGSKLILNSSSNWAVAENDPS